MKLASPKTYRELEGLFREKGELKSSEIYAAVSEMCGGRTVIRTQDGGQHNIHNIVTGLVRAAEKGKLPSEEKFRETYGLYQKEFAKNRAIRYRKFGIPKGFAERMGKTEALHTIIHKKPPTRLELLRKTLRRK